MFIVTDESSIVKYVSAVAPEVCADRIKFASFDDCTLRESNCTVIETDIAIPADWTGNKYLWDSGFVLNPAFIDQSAP